MRHATTMLSATPTKHRFVEVDGLEIFYREAGDPASPTLLLHGFMPRLAIATFLRGELSFSRLFRENGRSQL